VLEAVSVHTGLPWRAVSGTAAEACYRLASLIPIHKAHDAAKNMVVDKVRSDHKDNRMNRSGYEGGLTGHEQALGAGRDGEQNTGRQ